MCEHAKNVELQSDFKKQTMTAPNPETVSVQTAALTRPDQGNVIKAESEVLLLTHEKVADPSDMPGDRPGSHNPTRSGEPLWPGF